MKICATFAALAVVLLGLPARAQSGLQDFFFSLGTTTQDAAGRHWVFLLWDSTTPGALGTKHYAIYQKTGDVASASLYVRKALVTRQTDPRLIAPLLQRGANLGENLGELDASITKLFQSMTNAMSLPLPEKISAVIRGATGQPQHEANLRILARLHPGLAMCLGAGHAELILGPPGLATFEIREYDPTTQKELGVVGRVTVIAGAPVVLPAPGKPVQVPETDARGHLNGKLRWALPDDLRRLSLLNNGFNVWRVTRAFAETNGFQNTPPPAATLRALALGNPAVRLVNHVPVLKTKDFDAFNVADFSGSGDPITFFFVDDNDEFSPGGVPFNNGDQFYYFVTARDVLGRDGLVSPGTLVTMCYRLPPTAPGGVRVENDYAYSNSVPKQALRVFWRSNVNKPGDTALNYYLYRWTSTTQMVVLEGNPLANRIAGPIPHVAGVSNLSYLDNGAGAPTSTNADQTFWYTVRAGDDSACGENLSPNSGPAYGVLRDRVGPNPPTGGILINCASPVASFLGASLVAEGGLDTNSACYRVQCRRTNSVLQWAEFTVSARCPVGFPQTTLPSERIEFDSQTGWAVMDFTFPRAFCAGSDGQVPTITVVCKVALSEGQTTLVSNQFQAFPAVTQRRVISFGADVMITPTLASPPVASGVPVHLGPPSIGPGSEVRIPVQELYSGSARVQGSSDLLHWTDVATVPVMQNFLFFTDVAVLSAQFRFYRVLATDYSFSAPCAHFPGDPNTGTNAGIPVQVCFTPGTTEYRLYRSVGDGPRSLLAQGEVNSGASNCVTRVDDALPAVGAEVGYFAQLLDRHGNPSPLTRLGKAFVVRTPPCPLLSPVLAVESNGAPKMLLSWFCPPAAAERFKIYVETGAGQPPQRMSPSTSGSTLTSPIRRTVFLDSHVRSALFKGAYETERIGSSSMGDGPQFSIALDANPGEKYTIQVKAVGAFLAESDNCLAREFTWHPPVVAPIVPWPARALPPVNPNFDARIASALLYNPLESWTARIDTNAYPVGVRIGQGLIPRCAPYPNYVLLSGTDPARFLYGAAGGKPVLPVVLYRQQVPNANFPLVSGDVTQVSPLIENLAFSPVASCLESQSSSLKDPLIKVIDAGPFSQNDSYSLGDLYLADTQPVVAGARYRYLLMRFDPRTKEPEQIIPAGEVEIPEP